LHLLSGRIERHLPELHPTLADGAESPEHLERKAESQGRRAERGGRMGDQIFCDAVIAAGIFYLGVCLCFIACPARGVRILRWSRKQAEKTENRRYF
jgi:hypothetical protein